MRYHFQGRVRSTYGNVIPNENIYVYLAGTTTDAVVYTTYSGGNPISVSPQISSDSVGYFHFYISDDNYVSTQLFDIHVADEVYSYIDILGESKIVSGRESLENGISSKTVTYNIPYDDIDYTLVTSLTNTSDTIPSIYPCIVTSKTITGFTVEFSGTIDTSNYILEWQIKHD